MPRDARASADFGERILKRCVTFRANAESLLSKLPSRILPARATPTTSAAFYYHRAERRYPATEAAALPVDHSRAGTLRFQRRGSFISEWWLTLAEQERPNNAPVQFRTCPRIRPYTPGARAAGRADLSLAGAHAR